MNRSKRVVFVSHCLLNQNTRAINQERYPGIVKEIMELFLEADIGIVQLPCPQIEQNGGGIKRKFQPGKVLEGNGYRAECKKMSTSIIKQIEKYLKEDYNVVGIVGVEFSPTCAVHQINNGKKNVPGRGILIEELESKMQKKNFQVPIIGVNLNNIFSSTEKIQSLLKFF